MSHSAAPSTGTLTVCILGVVSLVACGDSGGSIDLAVSFTDGLPRTTVDSAERVEVYLVDRCEDVPLGGRPEDALGSTVTLRDGTSGPSIGAVDPGEYAIYARAQDGDCAVVAAGCRETSIDGSTRGPLEVVLEGFAGPPCGGDQQCVIETGDCTGGTGEVPCDAQPDETACTSGGAAGTCWSQTCCTGCWDGETCHPGDRNQNCGAGGVMCEFVPGCPF